MHASLPEDAIVSRRTLVKGAAWSLPVVALAVASPAAASTGCDPETLGALTNVTETASGGTEVIAPLPAPTTQDWWGWGQHFDAPEDAPADEYWQTGVVKELTVPMNANPGSVSINLDLTAHAGNEPVDPTSGLGNNSSLVAYVSRVGDQLGTPLVTGYARAQVAPSGGTVFDGQIPVGADKWQEWSTGVDGYGLPFEAGQSYRVTWYFRMWGRAGNVIATDDLFIHHLTVKYTYNACQ